MMGFFRNVWTRMSRVKSQHLPPFFTHYNNKDEFSKGDQNCWIHLATLSTATTFGIVVIGQFETSLIVPLIISAVGQLLSVSLAEFLTSHKQGSRSVYSCFYHCSYEILAFVLGWLWLLSLCSSLAATCKVLSSSVDSMLDHQLSKLIEDKMAEFLMSDVVAIPFVILVMVFSLSGLSQSLWWFVVTMNLAFVTIIVAGFLVCFTQNETVQLNFEEIFSVVHPQKFITELAVCSTIFIGSHNALRLPISEIHKKLGTLFGLVNVVCFSLVFLFASAWQIIVRSTPFQHLTFTSSTNAYVFWSFVIISLLLLGLEFHQIVLIHVQDMAADGLLFRCFAKKWKPFCGVVPSFWTYCFVSLITCCLATTLSFIDVMKLASVGPLLLNSAVSIMVMLQRYRDQDSWQYEPMFQNGESTRILSRKRSTEFLPVGRTSLNTPDESSTDTGENSDTDIDGIVQEYKDELNITQVKTLNCSTNEQLIYEEPTPESSCRAKWLIFGHFSNCLLLGVTFAVGCRIQTMPMAAFFTAVSLSIIVSVVFLILLHKLPQNSSTSVQNKIRFVPWTPGAAVWLFISVIIHILVDVWNVITIWLIVGIFLYLVYGMHQSVAAISFYGSSNSRQISLRPFPKEKEGNLSKVVLQQKRLKNKLKVTQLK